MVSAEATEWAQGSLGLVSPTELLQLLVVRRFSGRLALISASTPRRVVAVHLDRGRPHVVVGTGLSAERSDEDASFRARQTLLEALSWTKGSFRVESAETLRPVKSHPQRLGDVEDLLSAAGERARTWPKLVADLPGRYEELLVAPGPVRADGGEPERVAVLAAIDGPTLLGEVARRAHLDEHLALKTVVDLERLGALVLGTEGEMATETSPELTALVRQTLDFLQTEDDSNLSLKITVLSWDAASCFRAVEALLGRDREPPPGIEGQPRYDILHEARPLADGYRLEILAFRADTFEPVFAAPLVQESHLFLLFTDIDAGHLGASERPLVDRVNELRSMFRGASVAGRITIGGGAVTDHGADVIIPELLRCISWSDISTPDFLPRILREVGSRIGIPADASLPSS